MADNHTITVRPFPTTNVPVLTTIADNKRKWSNVVRVTAAAHNAGHYLDRAPSPASQSEVAHANALKLFIFMTVADCHQEAIINMPSHKAFAYLQNLNGTLTISEVNRAHVVPPLSECESTCDYVEKHRARRSALQAISTSHFHTTVVAFIDALLAGLPTSDSDCRQLTRVFGRMTEPSESDVESLIQDILRLHSHDASASGASRPRPHRHLPNTKSTRKKYNQPPGDLNRKYECQYCLADSHKELDCGRKKRGVPGQFPPREPSAVPSAAAATTTAPAADTSAAFEQFTAFAALARAFGLPAVKSDSQYTRSPVILDSAASHHMSSDPTDFTNLRHERIPIKLATTDSTQAAGIGTMLLKAAKRPIHLASSLFVPKLRSTLISAARLADKYAILMQSGKFWLLPKQAEPDTRSALATGSAVNGVYRFDDLASPSAAAAATTPTSSFRVPAQYRRLHNVFNHAHLRKLQQLASLYPSLAPAQPRRTANVEHSCEPCHIGKLTSAPHPSSPDLAKTPLETVSIDTAGPLPASRRGNRYFTVLRDAATKHLSILPTSSKSAAGPAIVNRLKQLQTSIHAVTRRIQSDNAKELTLGSVKRFADAQGTSITTTVPHSPAMNGAAERAVRAIKENTRVALAATKLGPEFWDYAAEDATDKYNALPHATYPAASPHAAFFSTEPHASRFQPFGQWGYAKIAGNQASLQPRAVKVQYLQSPSSSIYLVLDPATRQVVRCRPADFSPLLPSLDDKPPAQAALATPLITLPSETTSPKSLRDALTRPDGHLWAAAHDAAIDRNFELGAWKPVPVSAEEDLAYPLWVYTAKTDAVGALEKRSARCAVRGDRYKPNVHYDPMRTAAQTPSHTAQRLFYAAAAVSHEYIESYDVPGAYPRAPNDPKFRVVMRQPPRADGSLTHPGCNVLLSKAAQGAPDAGYLWERHRNDTLLRLGWLQVKSEPSAFLHRSSDGASYARLLASTDDFLVSTNDPEYLSTLRGHLQHEWNATVQSPLTQHAGIKVNIFSNGDICLSAPKHVDTLLQQAKMTACNPTAVPHIPSHDMRARQPHEPPLAPSELKQYQRLLGITRYIADTVGYEIALATSELASHMVDPCERHEKALKRLIRYIGGRRDMSVTYSGQNGLASPPHIEAWVDSDWAKCTDTRRSRTGIAITFAGDMLHWRSQLQKTVSTSSSEAEYIAASQAARDIKWLRQLASEWGITLQPPGPTVFNLADKHGDDPNATVLRVDNQGAIAMAHANGPTSRSKHIDIAHHFINEQVRANVIAVKKVSTSNQKADFLTKNLTRFDFKHNIGRIRHR
jgi:Reverse transcriptase (RNA-dependent DNA polymerase)